MPRDKDAQNTHGEFGGQGPDNHGPQRDGGPERGNKKRRKRGGESLEDRILFSGTWTDIDTGDVIDGATDGGDAFAGTDADEIASGLDGNDELFGGGGDDILSGGEGDDILDGGEGDDILSSDGGSDVMSGGAGDDAFVIEGAQDGDVLTIDGGSGTDRIDLSAYDGEMTFSDGSVEVELDGGGSFRVEYTDIETISVGDLTLNDSTISADATIQADSLTITNSYRLDADISVSGDVVTTDTSVGGTGVISLDGDGDQTISANGGTGEISNLSIDKASGSVTVSDNIQISNSYTDNGYAVDASGATMQFEGYATIDAAGTDFGDVTFYGGTFTIEGEMDVGGDLHIDSAYGFNSGTISVAGDVITTDTGVGGTGVISLDGDGDQTISANGGTGEISNLSIDKASGSVTVSDNIQISNSYTDNGYAVDASGATMQFEGYATIDAAGTDFGDVTFYGGTFTIEGEMDVGGDLHIDSAYGFNSGTISVAGDVITTDTGVGGTGVISLDGDGDQTISANGGTGEISNLSIDKASGSVTVSDNIQISNSYTDNGYAVDASGATMQFEGYATIDAAGTDFGDVTFYGGTFTIEGEMDVGGDLHIDSAYGFNSGTISVAGDVITTDTGVGGTGVISLDGDGDQTISANGGTGEISNLSIDKASGSVTVSDNIQISNSYTDNGYAVDASGATMQFEGYATIDAAGTDFGDVTFYGGTFTVESDLWVGGDLTVQSAYNINGVDIHVSGETVLNDSNFGGNADIRQVGETHEMGDGGSTFTVDDYTDGETMVVRGGAGADTLDLSAFESSDATFRDGVIEIHADDGTSFAVGYSDIETISFADGDASVLDGDATGAVSGGQGFLIAGDTATSIGFDGAGSVEWSFDADSGSLTITGVDGADAGSTLTIDSISDSVMPIESVTIESDIGAITSGTDIGTLTIDHEAVVGSVSVEGGTIGTVSFEGGVTSAGPIEFNADIGTIQAEGVGADVTINGDVGTITITDDITNDATLRVTGDVGSLDIGDDVSSNADVVIEGSADVISIGGEIEPGSTLVVGGDLGSFSATQSTGDITVGGNAGSITIDGAGDDSDLGGTLSVGGNLTLLNVADDVEGSISVGGDAGTLTAGDDFSGSGPVSVVGDLGSISAGGVISQDVSVGNDLGSFSAEHATGDLTVGEDAGTIRITGSGGDADFRGDLAVGGDLTELTVADDVEGSISVGGNAGTLTAGDDFKGDGSVTIGGALTSMTAGDLIGVDVTTGGDIGTISAPTMTGDLTVGDDLSVFDVDQMDGTIYGSGDHNYLNTSASDETIQTGAGNDYVVANGGDDTISLGDGNDVARVGDASMSSDTIDGGSGTDGVDYVDAGSGVDIDLEAGTATGATEDDTLISIENATGSEFDDTITGTDGNNALSGRAGDDVIDAGAGNDTLTGGEGSDTLNAGDGDDTVYAGDSSAVGTPAADTISGGDGTDTLSYYHAGAGVEIDMNAGTATGASEDDTFTGIENVLGSSHDDTITGDAGDNIIDGESGDDVIDAGAGDDQIYGGYGDDTIDGGDGEDWVRYNDIGGGVDVDLDAGTASGAGGNDTISNVENVYGSAYDDTIQGDAGDNTIQGYYGDDTIRGGLGDDTLDGDSGTDTVSYSDIEGGGVDVNLADGTATGAGGNDTLLDFENAEGSNQDDSLVGNSGDNVLSGLDGDDTIDGGAGNDTIYGGAGADTIDGGEGNDTIDGGAGNDNITGGEGNDSLRGGAGNDVLDGGSGDDLFVAGTGDDTLIGGAGTDTADYSASSDAITVDLGEGTVISDAGSDTFESIESFVGSQSDDTFLFDAIAADDHFTIDGHGGSNTLDLSNFSRTDIEMTREGDSIVVTLPSGETATVDFSNIDRVILSDADFDPNVPPHDAVPDEGTLNEDGSFTTGTLLDTDALDNGRAFIENIDQPEHGTVTVNEDGTFTYTPDPDYAGTDSFSYTIDDVTGDTTATVTLSVTPDADAPIVVVSDASGAEDSAVSLDLSASLTDTDGSETLSVTVGNVPDGASLSAGADNGDGTWTLAPDDLDGLTITPPADFAGDFDLEVTATTTDGSDTAAVSDTVTVSVDAVADAPVLTVSDASGLEDTAIELDLSASLTDTDGSETLSVTVGNVPDGASLSAGADNGDGTWTLAPDDLDGLTITPPADFAGDFDLEVTATTTDGADTAAVSDTVTVSVDAVADAPVLTVSDASGLEDTAIELDLSASLTDTDGSETLSVTVGNVPDGASLSAGADNGDGTWTLAPDDLDGLTITPPADFAGDFDLEVTATTTDGSDTAAVSDTVTVSVDAVADAPVLTVDDASGLEDTAIGLDLSASLTDTDGSETLSVTVGNVPDGASLSAGADNGDGTWTLAPDDLDGLTITPPADFAGDFDLEVTATTTDGADTAAVSDTVTVSVEADADAPVLTVDDASGLEDTAIGLDLSASLTDTDGSETLSITVSNVPDGASLSAGVDNGDGSWTLTPDQLDGLELTPPSNYSGEFELSIAATSTDGTDTATVSDTFAVSVDGVADEASLSVADATGTEDQPIALDIVPALNDLDGSETFSVTVSDVPEAASLSAGTDNGDGTWTLTPDQVGGLEITPPSNFSGEFELGVSVTTTDGDSTSTVDEVLSVSVAGAADDAILSVGDVTGYEDEPISLDLSASLTDTDGSETLSLTISNVPDGASLSAGTDNGDGTWTLTPDQLDGLELTPPSNYSGEFELGVAATTTDGASTSTVSDSFNVELNGVIDGSAFTVTDASGFEDQPIALDIAASLVDLDGSESLSVTISGVPDGATFSAGTDNGDGSWTLAPDQLDGLQVTPPSDYSGDFDLTVTATTTGDGSVSSVSDTLTVSVEGVSDGLAFSGPDEINAITGEDAPLGVSARGFDTDGSETLRFTVSNLPEGVSLTEGTANADGTWTLTPDELGRVSIDTSAGYAGSFEVTIIGTSTEADGDAVSEETTVSVNITPPVDTTPEAPETEAIPAPVAEIAWDDVELGVIDTVSEIDQTLEDIEGQVDRLDLPSTDPDAPRESLAYTQIAEVPPLDAADGVDDSPLPPPTSPIFEFTHDEGATKAEINDAGRLTVPTAEAGGTAQSETQDAAETARTQFGRSFAFLWGLLRSVGGRPIEGKAGAQNGPSKN